MSTLLLDSHEHGDKSELFVVEGKSAQHAVDQVRSRKTQAVLSMQGKVPNAARHSKERVLANEHCRALIETLACGTGTDCTPGRLRYGQIRLLADGDIDGSHGRILLLCLFKLYLHPLITAGLVGVLTAPRYRVDLASNTEKTAIPDRPSSVYMWTENQKRRYIDNQPGPDKGTITAFKGVASLARDELHHLLIDRATRLETIVSPDMLIDL